MAKKWSTDFRRQLTIFCPQIFLPILVVNGKVLSRTFFCVFRVFRGYSLSWFRPKAELRQTDYVQIATCPGVGGCKTSIRESPIGVRALLQVMQLRIKKYHGIL